jgi:hypothetical protein
LFLEAVAVFIWRVADDRLQAVSAGCGFIGLLVGTPAAIAALGFDPTTVGRHRIALANQLRRLGRSGARFLFAGLTTLFTPVVLAAAHTRVPRGSLPVFEAVLFLGLFLTTVGGVSMLLPRRFVAHLPNDVEVVSPLGLMKHPRAEALCGVAAIALFALSELVGLAASA